MSTHDPRACPNCRRARHTVRAEDIARHVHESRGGWVLAVWSARDAQWTTADIPRAARESGFSSAFARRLDALDVVVHPSRASALRALPQPDPWEDACACAALRAQWADNLAAHYGGGVSP